MVLRESEAMSMMLHVQWCCHLQKASYNNTAFCTTLPPCLCKSQCRTSPPLAFVKGNVVRHCLWQCRTNGSVVARTARSVEDETPNTRRNPNRNPECCGDFSQLVEIEKLKFLFISRYKFKLRF